MIVKSETKAPILFTYRERGAINSSIIFRNVIPAVGYGNCILFLYPRLYLYSKFKGYVIMCLHIKMQIFIHPFCAFYDCRCHEVFCNHNQIYHQNYIYAWIYLIKIHHSIVL